MNTGKTATILIAIVAAFVLTVTPGMAGKAPTVGGSGDNNGLRTQGDAGGIKLIGPLFVVYPDYPADDAYCGGVKCAASAEVTLRLRKGNDLQVFYTVLEGPLYPESDPESVQDAIVTGMAVEVLDYFFPGEFPTPILKSAEEFISDNFCTEYLGATEFCAPGAGVLVTSTDVVIAVK